MKYRRAGNQWLRRVYNKHKESLEQGSIDRVQHKAIIN